MRVKQPLQPCKFYLILKVLIQGFDAPRALQSFSYFSSESVTAESLTIALKSIMSTTQHCAEHSNLLTNSSKLT